MKVSIINIQGNTVKIQTAIGCVNVFWGLNQCPEQKEYEVEVSSDDVICKSSVSYSSVNNPAIVDTVSGLEITGFLECIEDNVMFLNILDDTIMLEVHNEPDLLGYIGHYVTVKLTHITVFDCGY